MTNNEELTPEKLAAAEALIIPHLAQQFRRAALVHAFGHEDNDQKISDAGCRAMRRVVMDLDVFSPGTRIKALEPMLAHRDWNVREAAATCLVYHLPEQALAVLKDVKKNGPYKASIRAMFSLLAHKSDGLKWINGMAKETDKVKT